MQLTRRNFLAGALALPALSALSACAGTVVSPGDLSRLRMMVPASPGWASSPGRTTTPC